MHKENGYLTFHVETSLGIAELIGPNVRYWNFKHKVTDPLHGPAYDGPIDDAPQEWIDALLEIGAIKAA